MPVELKGSTSGSVTLAAPAVAGSNTVTLPAVTGTAVVSGQNSALTLMTSQASTSGTSIDFTGIPSWVRRITVCFNGVSTNGSSYKLVQLIYGGSTVVSSGYASGSTRFNGGTLAGTTATNGFLNVANNASDTLSGSLIISNHSGNVWVASGTTTYLNDIVIMTGGVTLSGTLTGVRITTSNGTDTFDAGSINVMYE